MEPVAFGVSCRVHRRLSLRFVAVTVFLASLSTAAAVALTPQNCFLGPFDLSSVPTLNIALEQYYNSNYDLHHWTINLCTPVNSTFGPQCAKNGAGYVSEHRVANGNCETTWNTVVSVLPESSTIVYGETQTSNYPLWTASVQLSCGPTLELQAANSVVVVTTHGGGALNFFFQLSTSALCATAPMFNCDAGCAFLMISGASFVVYFVGMTLINAFVLRRGRPCCELFPWDQLKAILCYALHGMRYVFRCGAQQPRHVRREHTTDTVGAYATF